MALVLVVDDDPAIRTMLARALESTGAHCEQAPNGMEALKLLAAKKYDLMLLDLHMTGIDGLQVLRTVSGKDGLNRDTPVCVITADGSDHVRTESLQHRAMLFLTKPVHLVTLLALVGPILRRADGKKTVAPPR